MHPHRTFRFFVPEVQTKFFEHVDGFWFLGLKECLIYRILAIINVLINVDAASPFNGLHSFLIVKKLGTNCRRRKTLPKPDDNVNIV